MNSYSTVCVDASVIVRLVLQPEDSAITQLWDSWISHEYRLVAPGLLYYEVTNALFRYQKSGLIKPGTIQDALDTALALPIDLISDADLHRRARILADHYRLPATNDAHYLALSEQLNADLWTADARLYKALQPFKIKWVKLVGISVSKQ
jgi:predicted nucleic acid-binding protein